MLTKEQENKGYQIEFTGEYVLVWYNKKQIGLLMKTPDVSQRIQTLVEKHQQEFETAMAGS